ncbi:MAG: hypothetical protein HQ512_12360 [Rhodospirillales bacterium]|nr:hypothetical protein [Rhodospirillales bacterium]
MKQSTPAKMPYALRRLPPVFGDIMTNDDILALFSGLNRLKSMAYGGSGPKK